MNFKMNHIGEKIMNWITYPVAFTGIAFNFENFKGYILFVGSLILIVMQIYLHWIKIKKEKDGKY